MLSCNSFFPNYTEQRHALLVKIASVREVVLGAPIRIILKHLASRKVAPDLDRLVALVHRPNESFFLVPQVHVFFFKYIIVSFQKTASLEHLKTEGNFFIYLFGVCVYNILFVYNGKWELASIIIIIITSNIFSLHSSAFPFSREPWCWGQSKVYNL